MRGGFALVAPTFLLIVRGLPLLAVGCCRFRRLPGGVAVRRCLSLSVVYRCWLLLALWVSPFAVVGCGSAGGGL